MCSTFLGIGLFKGKGIQTTPIFDKVGESTEYWDELGMRGCLMAIHQAYQALQEIECINDVASLDGVKCHNPPNFKFKRDSWSSLWPALLAYGLSLWPFF